MIAATWILAATDPTPPFGWKIAAVLGILAIALILFVTEKLRMDVVALLVLSTLAMMKLVSPQEALAGFSNPAVVTVWAMFILSAGLSATGVADAIGRQVLRIAGKNEPRIIVVIMIATAAMSAFMNNIGVAALMLPVVMDIARRTETSPSRLLMPMAYASLLGGLTTLVGTPPNLVASEALRQAGLEGFSLFEFAPVGVPALVLGTLFIAFIGRHFLPAQIPESFQKSIEKAGTELRFAHDLEQRRFQLQVGPDSPFAGRSLGEIRIGEAFGLTVYAVQRGGEALTIVDRDFTLETGDILFVQGSVEEFSELMRWRAFELASGSEIAELLAFQKLVLLSVTVAEDSNLVGLSVQECDFRKRFRAHILSIRRGDELFREGLAGVVLEAGDRLQIEMKKEHQPVLENAPQFSEIQLIVEEKLGDIYREGDSLLELHIPGDSHLAGLTIAESGLGERLRLRVVGIARKGGNIPFPDSEERFQPGDKLLIHGNRDQISLLRGVQSLERTQTGVEDAELFGRTDTGYTEVTLAPQSSLAGKTLREVNFRKRYGLDVLSIWRQGRSFGSYLRNMVLQFGDALLLAGPRERIEALAEDEDFLILTRAAYETPAKESPLKAWLAAGIMLGVVGLVLAGFLPIALAAIAGSTLMIATRCLSIEAAYRAIEWKSVFLIACMIPLGAAMQTTGAANWLAEGVAAAARPFGPWGMIVGLYLLTMLATTIVPTAALVVIMSSIALGAAPELGIEPKLIIMAIAMAASASFTSPISHPANVLVMGPGGYRFVDYIKQGILLAIVVALTVLPMLAWRY